MDMWIIWLIIAVVLMIIEVMTQMLWALCLAVGCLGGLIASLCGASTIWQSIVLAICSIAAYIFLVPLFQKWHALSVDRKGRAARTGMDALLGRKSILSEEIRPGHPGRGRIDGDHWQMVTADQYQVVPKGTEVIVTGYDSIILTVIPADEA